MINKPKRALMLIMGALVIISFGIAQLYYSYENNSVDPRIVEARQLYSRYDNYTELNNFKGIFSLLDSIENIYNAFQHYENSFEMGVLYNNRAAAYLSMALYFENNSLSLDGITTLSKDSLIELSDTYVAKSIQLYENWLIKYADKDKIQIKNSLKENFSIGLEEYTAKENQRFLLKRIQEIQEAQLETKRRLSVAYTNLGIVKRHQGKYKEAIEHYTYALKLWDRNLSAENNLNTLFNQPLKKPNMLQKILPPDKNK